LLGIDRIGIATGHFGRFGSGPSAPV